MIYRIEVQPRSGHKDPAGEQLAREALSIGLVTGRVQSQRVFLIDSPESEQAIRLISQDLLADPVAEDVILTQERGSLRPRIEVHPKPGVMDPVAMSTLSAIRRLGREVRDVRTGKAWVLEKTLPDAALRTLAQRLLANSVVENVHITTWFPEQFPEAKPGDVNIRRVALSTLTDDDLKRLSRQAHLFLSVEEMQAVQAYFQSLGRDPTDVELETIAQTWSEHCVHKTLKSRVDLKVKDSLGRVVETRSYGNLIKDTIFASTQEIIRRHGSQQPFCLSVFVDNAGVIAFDDDDAVCFKVETHNHPSALEPYGGSATGAGGVIRDVLGTGMAARPVANTDVFCVAQPEFGKGEGEKLPAGVVHPRRTLQQVVAGVRDYGNRMGIPTVNGAVYFDNRYLANPLVFCGCAGLLPRKFIGKKVSEGEAIVLMGGRTGRDGIHGATFSSAELTDTHADEFSHAVQIGNAITEKTMTDVILDARDKGLYTAITDCGAGGLSSAVGEMGADVGAEVRLDRVPLKYAGLKYDEIWISEAQERMVLSVPQDKVEAILHLAAQEDVEACVIGTFGTPGAQLVLHYREHEVARVAMAFLHDGIPRGNRSASVDARPIETPPTARPGTLRESLLKALAEPNIASKHYIVRQYDHEVQGGSVVKPLVGFDQAGPSDASVLRPKLGSMKGVVLSCGLRPHVADPYAMGVHAIDEAVRNAVCVGADPSRLAVLDNFCWPSVDDEKTMGELVRTCEACRDVALAWNIPFISGKDSLHNQFTNRETGTVIRIPNTLLVSAIGVIDDVRRCLTMPLKAVGSRILQVSSVADGLDLASMLRVHRAMAGLIRSGKVLAAHDVSDGGAIVAIAEMAIAANRGVRVDAMRSAEDWFAEDAASYLVEVAAGDVDAVTQSLGADARVLILGEVLAEANLRLPHQPAIEVSRLRQVWTQTLDW